MKKLLLTGLERFINDNENIYALGPWCFLNHDMREKMWKESEFEPTFSDSDSLKLAADYALEYSLHLIDFLSKEMNLLHGRNYSKQYWHTLLMPWVCTAVQVFYERYIQLTRLINDDEKYEVELMPTTATPTFKDVREFKKFVITAEGNHYIYSLLLEKMNPVDWKLNYGNIHVDIEGSELRNSYSSWFQKKKRHYKRVISRNISLALGRVGGVFIEGVYGLSFFDELYLNISSFFHGNSNRRHLSGKIKVNEELIDFDKLSNFSINIKARNEFEKYFSDLLPKLMPVTYLSEYNLHDKRAVKFVNKISKRTNLFLLGPLLGGYDPMKFIVGLFRERGGVLAQTQHGANYGTAQSFPFMASFEYLNSEIFLTWGWKNQSNYSVNAFPLPSPLLSKIRKHNDVKNEILLVGTLVSLYSDRLASNPQPQQCLEYRRGKIYFINSLSTQIRKLLWYRPYYSEAGGLPERSFIKTNCPDVKIFEGTLEKKLEEAKCVVLDHPGTTLNVVIAMNKPLILYWNQEHWSMCEQARHVFTNLRNVGILHDDAKSAATFINSIWEGIQEWWLSAEVQMARKLFSDLYARSDVTWRKQWLNFLTNPAL